MRRRQDDKLTIQARGLWKRFSADAGITLTQLDIMYSGCLDGAVDGLVEYCAAERGPVDFNRLKTAAERMAAGREVTLTMERIAKFDSALRCHREDYDLLKKMRKIMEVAYRL